jgi:hypothetical protein
MGVMERAKSRYWRLVIILLITISVVMLTHGGDVRAEEKAFGDIVLPQGLTEKDVVLIVEGKIGNGIKAQFDMETIEKFPKVSFKTWDPWDSQERRYEGARLVDVLRFLKMESSAKQVVVHASNDYQAVLSVEDLDRIGYILAYRMDGKYFSELGDKNNKGPLAIAVDFNSNKSIEIEIYKQNLVWWIDVIRVR